MTFFVCIQYDIDCVWWEHIFLKTEWCTGSAVWWGNRKKQQKGKSRFTTKMRHIPCTDCMHNTRLNGIQNYKQTLEQKTNQSRMEEATIKKCWCISVAYCFVCKRIGWPRNIFRRGNQCCSERWTQRICSALWISWRVVVKLDALRKRNTNKTYRLNRSGFFFYLNTVKLHFCEWAVFLVV